MSTVRILHGRGGGAATEMAFSSALQRWRQNGLGWSQNRTSFPPSSLPPSPRDNCPKGTSLFRGGDCTRCFATIKRVLVLTTNKLKKIIILLDGGKKYPMPHLELNKQDPLRPWQRSLLLAGRIVGRCVPMRGIRAKKKETFFHLDLRCEGGLFTPATRERRFFAFGWVGNLVGGWNLANSTTDALAEFLGDGKRESPPLRREKGALSS